MYSHLIGTMRSLAGGTMLNLRAVSFPIASLRTALMLLLMSSSLGLVLIGARTSSSTEVQAESESFLVVAVRHAEKKDNGRDPALTEEGMTRAAALSRFLADIELSAIYSTEFRRTRETARPVLEQRGLELLSYDPRALGALAERILTRGENALVVGHSNTTPELVRRLGGSMPGKHQALPEELDEAHYDRVYVVRVSEDLVETSLYHLPPFDDPR